MIYVTTELSQAQPVLLDPAGIKRGTKSGIKLEMAGFSARIFMISEHGEETEELE